MACFESLKLNFRFLHSTNFQHCFDQNFAIMILLIKKMVIDLHFSSMSDFDQHIYDLALISSQWGLWKFCRWFFELRVMNFTQLHFHQICSLHHWSTYVGKLSSMKLKIILCSQDFLWVSFKCYSILIKPQTHFSCRLFPSKICQVVQELLLLEWIDDQ